MKKVFPVLKVSHLAVGSVFVVFWLEIIANFFEVVKFFYKLRRL